MSVLSVSPELVSVAASDLAGVGSAIAEANSLAAAPTLGVVAPAADSVSAELAVLFGGHAQTYQGVSAQGQMFHEEFVSGLARSTAAYSRAEAESATGLGRGHAADGVRLLSSRQHHAAAGAASRLWQPGRPALWRPGMSDPRLVTPRHSLPAGARLWHPGVPGFKAHSFTAPRLFTPHNELMGGIQGGPRGIVQNIAALIKQIIENQISYLKLTVTSLFDFVKDELKAIIGLPEAFIQSFKDLLHGNIYGAMKDIEKGFLHFFVNGMSWDWGYWIQGLPDSFYKGSFLGPLADLAHIAQIPAKEMQNLADLLKPLGFGIMGNLVQHLATPLDELTSGWHIYVRWGSQPFAGIILDQPLAMLFDVLGAPILGVRAFQESLQSTFNALAGGHPLNALLDLVAAPANALHAFLFGQGYLELPTFTSPRGGEMQGAVHLGGLFAPLDYGEQRVDPYYGWVGVPDSRYGTLTGGLVPALVSMLPPILQKPLFQLGAFLDSIIAILERHPAQP